MIRVEMVPSPADIVRRLETFSADLQDGALKAGLTGAARPLKNAMKAAEPKMAKYIGQRQLSGTARGRLGLDQYERAILVGATRRVASGASGRRTSGAKKAIWLEFGTAPHKIVPGSRNRRGILRIGNVFARHVDHPGVHARYWMARANSAAGTAMADAFYRAMSRYLDRKAGA